MNHLKQRIIECSIQKTNTIPFLPSLMVWKKLFAFWSNTLNPKRSDDSVPKWLFSRCNQVVIKHGQTTRFSMWTARHPSFHMKPWGKLKWMLEYTIVAFLSIHSQLLFNFYKFSIMRRQNNRNRNFKGKNFKLRIEHMWMDIFVLIDSKNEKKTSSKSVSKRKWWSTCLK